MKFSYLLVFILITLTISCKNGTEEKQVKEAFEMYETSELAILMEEFYVYNDSLKSQIINNETLSPIPANFDEIHTAKMTKRFERDVNFQQLSKIFEMNQKAIYSASSESLKSSYNLIIQTCVACHQTSCTGPIPRIEKLLID